MKFKIVTDRLILRDFKETDDDNLLDLPENPRVTCFMCDKLFDLSHALSHIKKTKR